MQKINQKVVNSRTPTSLRSPTSNLQLQYPATINYLPKSNNTYKHNYFFRQIFVYLIFFS